MPKSKGKGRTRSVRDDDFFEDDDFSQKSGRSGRPEVLELAREIAEERGGKPSQYMKEATYRINRGRGNEGINRKNRSSRHYEEAPSTKLAKMFLSRAANMASKASQRSVSSTKDKWNFMKPPKDSPSELGKMTGGFFTKKPDSLPQVPDSLKRMLKFW